MKKNRFGLRALIIMLVFGMVVIGCVAVPTTQASANISLNGDWDRGDVVISISGNNGVLSGIRPHFNRREGAMIGDLQLRNITQTGNLRWSAQHIFSDGSWHNITIIMNANGQTIRVLFQGFPDDTYSRVH